MNHAGCDTHSYSSKALHHRNHEPLQTPVYHTEPQWLESDGFNAFTGTMLQQSTSAINPSTYCLKLLWIKFSTFQSSVPISTCSVQPQPQQSECIYQEQPQWSSGNIFSLIKNFDAKLNEPLMSVSCNSLEKFTNDSHLS